MTLSAGDWVVIATVLTAYLVRTPRTPAGV